MSEAVADSIIPGAKGAGMAKKILLPTNDFVFKQVFGEQKNAKILSYFLQTTIASACMIRS